MKVIGHRPQRTILVILPHVGILFMIAAATEGFPFTSMHIRDEFWQDAIGGLGLFLALLGVYWASQSEKQKGNSADDATRTSCPISSYSAKHFLLFTSRALCAAWNLRGDRDITQRDGEFEYHIKRTSELHERVARERELRKEPPMKRSFLLAREAASLRVWNAYCSSTFTS